MADITETVSSVNYTFKEVNPETQWELEQEKDDNKYTLKLCKIGESWVGSVTIHTRDGAKMDFHQNNLTSTAILVRRLLEYSTRVQQLLVPLPKEF